MDGTGPQAVSRRRSLRIVMRIPLLISPADSADLAEWEPVETLVISLHGGLVRTRQQMQVGTTLDIRMRNRNRSTRGRVVWIGSEGNGKGFDLGFEILEPPGFWEIQFPPDRWSGSLPNQQLPC
jgi:hypothetical protein